jgi:uncharacterized protein YjbI with pentapeptide repeats
MLTKNLTPFLLGAKVCSRRPPAPEMTLIVRGTFLLVRDGPVTAVEGLMEQGPLTAEVFSDDDEDRRGECLYGGDFADFKLRAEVLVKGTCHAPGKKPVTECPVLFRVGGWSKMLRVVGPRVWTDSVLGPAFSEPQPFTEMPISYANAFGGPGFAPNPVGKGYKTRELPTVEAAGAPIRTRSDHPAPAGFGPLSPTWPQRAGKLGKEYGERWRKERAPYQAEDFDWSFFNAAPPDQQMEGYLRGDEEVTLQNLHPAAPVFTTRLPGLRVRAFVKDAEGRFREVAMSLDTLLAEPDEGTLELTWRGVTPVKADDLADVATVLCASEKLESERLPEAHYRAALEAFERDPVGLEARLPPGFADAAERRRKERAGEPLPAEPGDEALDPISRMLHKRMGSFAAAEQAKLRDAMQQVVQAAPKKDGIDLQAAADAAERRAEDVPPTAFSGKPGAMPDIGLRRVMRRVLEQTAELKKSLEGKPIPPAEIEKLRALEQLPFEPRLSQMDPGYTPPVEPISTDAPGPHKNLAEQDLTRRDLRGMDLTGADLTGAILTRADLRGAKLVGARLARAILFRANLDGADLTNADLTRANAARASAEGAILRGAVLEETFFEDAKLAGADLTGARGEYPVFTRADLRDAKLAGAVFMHGDFGQATLDRADFAGASLRQCSFAGCHAEGVAMRGADLARASFAGAGLQRAIFCDCRADESRWPRAILDGADFRYATLKRTLFNEASAVGANFFGANLRESRLYRARLDHAELVRANLFGANLEKAVLNGVKFTEASLYGARLTGAHGEGASFAGANLKRSTLERA